MDLNDVSEFDEPMLMKRFSSSTANPDVHGGKEHVPIDEDQDSDDDEEGGEGQQC